MVGQDKMSWARLAVKAFSMLSLTACGLTTPVKNLQHSSIPDASGTSAEGEYERSIFGQVSCELSVGLYRAQKKFQLPWVEHWGTAITLIISAQDQGGFAPGLLFKNPLANFAQAHAMGGTVTIQQISSVGIGASLSTSATRAETVQVTWINADLLRYGKDITSKNPGVYNPCHRDGLQIDGDLAISEFVWDKFQTANSNDLNPALIFNRNVNKWPVYNTLTEEIIFLSLFGGNFTPSWNLARVAANTTTNFLSAQRTYTNDLILTFGELATQPSPLKAASLGPAAQNQHNSKVNASAIATSIRSQGL